MRVPTSLRAGLWSAAAVALVVAGCNEPKVRHAAKSAAPPPPGVVVSGDTAPGEALHTPNPAVVDNLVITKEKLQAFVPPRVPKRVAPAAPKMEPKPAPADPAGENEFNTESYQHVRDNPFLLTARDPVSTFSAAVDTASYSNARRFLMEGRRPPKDAVRAEDFVNYFAYDYPAPKDGRPVAFHPEVMACPWKPAHALVRVGVQAATIDPRELPPRNLVFLVDSSGSMSDANKLPLVQQSLGLLVGQLTARDRVSLVTYAGDARLVLPPTPGDQKDTINAAVRSLAAGGSTNGGGGIALAYDQARLAFLDRGVNRVILCTDGDFNVGVASPGDLVRMIEQQRKSGVFLTVVGFGMGNLKDSTMEQLARHGNGHYAYVDSLDEAKKLFVEQGAALAAVAKDVKLQVEFNPKRVAAYRLIGYENRLLRAEDFKDDTKDAGDMGAGHQVTALYEVVPPGVPLELPGTDPLKYQAAGKPTPAADADEWLTVKMRYKHPTADTSEEVLAVLKGPAKKEASADFRFAAAAAAFAMLLRDSPHKGVATYAFVKETAAAAVGGGADAARRREFVELVTAADRLAR